MQQIFMTSQLKSPEAQLPKNRNDFRELFNQHYVPLCAYAFSKVRNQEAAREIVQDLFVHLWEKRMEITIHTSLSAYLYRAVLHASLNYLKHNRIVDRTHLKILESGTELPVQPDALAEEEELYETLVSALEKFPERTRMIFKKIRFEGKKYREVADEMKISVKTVEAHMSEALRILRIALQNFLLVLLFFTLMAFINL